MYIITSYKEPKLGIDSGDELSLKPLTLHDPNRSPTEQYETKSFVTQHKFECSSKDVDSSSMNEKDNYDELYSPTTESILLSPEIAGNSFVNLYETGSGEGERINQDIYCYGRLTFFHQNRLWL